MKSINLHIFRKILIISLLLFLLSSCQYYYEDGDNKIKVNGVLLTHKRKIFINDTDLYGIFRAEIHSGDVEITSGNSYQLEILIFEKEQKDLTLLLDKGKIVGATKTGKPFTICGIKGQIPSGESISIDTGVGDLTLSELEGEKMILNTGAGNITIEKSDFKTVEVNTGAGNLNLEVSETETINMHTGVGNIELSNNFSNVIECKTGVGNIKAYHVKAYDVDFTTGVGNIKLRGCEFENKNLSAGLGKIDTSNDI